MYFQALLHLIWIDGAGNYFGRSSVKETGKVEASESVQDEQTIIFILVRSNCSR
jgi:hypothetical protein